MILVVSHPDDEHARRVVERLHRAGQDVLRFDTADYPLEAPLEQGFDGQADRRTVLTVGAERVDLQQVHAVWWRRPRPFRLPEELADDVAAFTYSECHEALEGMWSTVDASWVNPPALDATAHHKPYQLAVAQEVGLEVPRTLITNDPTAARSFVAEVGLGEVVHKTFLATPDHWRETRLLRESELAALDHLRLAPAIFQRRVVAEADIRVTILGDELVATAITTSPGTYELDYRMALSSSRFAACSIPPAVEAAIRRLMVRLGLVYGAVDLLRRADGSHVFLEINPAGEWLFVEERTGQDISGGMASLLASLDVVSPPLERTPS